MRVAIAMDAVFTPSGVVGLAPPTSPEPSSPDEAGAATAGPPDGSDGQSRHEADTEHSLLHGPLSCYFIGQLAKAE